MRFNQSGRRRRGRRRAGEPLRWDRGGKKPRELPLGVLGCAYFARQCGRVVGSVLYSSICLIRLEGEEVGLANCY